MYQNASANVETLIQTLQVKGLMLVKKERMESCTVCRANENQQQDGRKVDTNTLFFAETKQNTHTHWNYNATIIYLYSLLAGEPVIKFQKKS